MSSPDLYAVLGVKREATPEEIKAAYRRIAKESHPDYHPGNPVKAERFRQATEAQEVLGDPKRRVAWDAANPPELSGSQVGLAVADLYDVVAIGMTGGARCAVGELIDRAKDAHWTGISSILKGTRRPAGAAGAGGAESELERLRRENRDLKEAERLRSENERLRSQGRRGP